MFLDNLRADRTRILALGHQYGACHIRVFGSALIIVPATPGRESKASALV